MTAGKLTAAVVMGQPSTLLPVGAPASIELHRLAVGTRHDHVDLVGIAGKHLRRLVRDRRSVFEMGAVGIHVDVHLGTHLGLRQDQLDQCVRCGGRPGHTLRVCHLRTDRSHHHGVLLGREPQ